MTHQANHLKFKLTTVARSAAYSLHSHLLIYYLGETKVRCEQVQDKVEFRKVYVKLLLPQFLI